MHLVCQNCGSSFSIYSTSIHRAEQRLPKPSSIVADRAPATLRCSTPRAEPQSVDQHPQSPDACSSLPRCSYLGCQSHIIRRGEVGAVGGRLPPPSPLHLRNLERNLHSLCLSFSMCSLNMHAHRCSRVYMHPSSRPRRRLCYAPGAAPPAAQCLLWHSGSIRSWLALGGRRSCLFSFPPTPASWFGS